MKQSTLNLTPEEKHLVNRWQKGFPLTSSPYAYIAGQVNLSESDVLAMLQSLKGRGLLSRVGAVVRPNTVGASSLVAMAVPDDRLEEVAGIVSASPHVNHNYERENELNLWFVVTAPNPSELDTVLGNIEDEAQLPTYKLPLKKAYHIDLGFKI